MNDKKTYLLRTIEEDFPSVNQFKRRYIGFTRVDVKDIIGGRLTRKEMYYSDFSIKKADDRYYNLVDVIKSRGIENVGATMDALGFVGLYCFNYKGKKYYYVSYDGHRRVSLSKKFNVQSIKAEVEEFDVKNIKD